MYRCPFGIVWHRFPSAYLAGRKARKPVSLAEVLIEIVKLGWTLAGKSTTTGGPYTSTEFANEPNNEESSAHPRIPPPVLVRDPQMVSEHMPAPGADTLILMCGPPPMLKFACLPALEALGFSDEMHFSF